ncbi:geranylgeranyl transferase type-1 subunit beta-like [Coffea eugenioides]|uniref:geranylgeranyl transferase type-1 subunit beta-like n=1 Tax=Coffea eugenioides TaxID=49369 RepID=UPI000F60FFB3|nr:geranylgeranyl transferase type-1 subunit beta-like [Coffea eugenioides]
MSSTMGAEEDDFLWDSDSEPQFFDKDRHLRFLEMMYDLLPSDYQTQEINRLTLAYFTIIGFDILGSLDRIDKDAVIKWVLSLQAHPKNKDDLNNGQFYGFHGSRSSQFQSNVEGALVPNGSHLACTYCALAILKTVGYDLSLIDFTSILKSMKNLQQLDGSFMPIHYGAETDLRFVFCAVAICFLLGNWSGLDREKAKDYIIKCQSYDGGFGLIPGSESHGGATYCAVASLRLMGYIADDPLSKVMSPCIIDVPMLVDWCLQRQAEDGGFQGRPNKLTDTCYAFWVGGVLKILGAEKFIDEGGLRGFLLTCQSQYGGFSKSSGQLPDLYHSFYGFCAFSLLDEPGLNPVSVEVGVTEIAAVGLYLQL